MDLECFSCFIKSLLSALWLVNDSAAVSLRYVLIRDRMTIFLFFQKVPFVVLPAVFLVIFMVDTCALMDIRTSQAVDRSRRHHTLQFTYMSHRSLTCCSVDNPSEVVPSFPFGSGAGCFLDSALMCISLEMRRDCSGKIISSSCRAPWNGVW